MELAQPCMRAAVSRLDIAVLLVVVADMITKPFS
jgi:hypothetical protein